MSPAEIGFWIATVSSAVSTAYTVAQFHLARKARQGSPADSYVRNRLLPQMSFVALSWFAVIFGFVNEAYRKADTVEPLIAAWGVSGSPAVYMATIQSSTLLQFKNTHKIMLINRVNYADVDRATDTTIEKSGLYTIDGAYMQIAHTTERKLRFVPKQYNPVEFHVVLVPNGVDPSQINCLSAVKNLGGTILATTINNVVGASAQEAEKEAGTHL